MKRITSFMGSFGQFWLDGIYPNRPTFDFPGLVVPVVPTTHKPRMVTHHANLGRFQVLYFVGFGARNLTVKWSGKAIVKIAVSI